MSSSPFGIVRPWSPRDALTRAGASPGAMILPPGLGLFGLQSAPDQLLHAIPAQNFQIVQTV